MQPVKENQSLYQNETEPKIKEPSLYQVVMHNDDFTPMEFVVSVLEIFFHMERVVATKIMYEIHMKGQAVCGVFTKDIAETKARQVVDHARSNEHPLMCSIEVT